MASTVLLKRRIKTAQNVSKTTKAMQLIAASKLKRAQDATFAQRPYVERLTTTTRALSEKLKEDFFLPPYMHYQEEAPDTSLLLVFSPDKGLCGGLISNLVGQFLSYKVTTSFVVTVGKKIEKYAASSKQKLLASFPFRNTLPSFDAVYPLISLIDEYYIQKKVKTVHILYSHFGNVFTQTPTITTLLPIVLEGEEHAKNLPPFQLLEPSIQDILPTMLRRYLEMSLYQYLLESYVSEQAARMVAMKNATDNANDIMAQLTLEYNKERQARITNEILDIISAANFMYA